MAKRKIIEIKENGEINALIDRRGNKERKRSISDLDKKNGYYHVNLSIHGKMIKALAHRVTWTYFKGRIPEGYQINHKDGNKGNNDINNLEIVTASENVLHARDVLKTFQDWRGEKNYRAKLTLKEARSIRRMRKKSLKVSEILKKINYKVSKAQIHNIINNKFWKEDELV